MNESLSVDQGSVEVLGGPLRILHSVARGFALGGGLVLIALVAMSLVSIIGRKLFSAPVHGDIELMEMGASVAIAAMLPLCELRGMHLKVEAFTLALPGVARRWLDRFAHLSCFLVAWLLAWRTGLQVAENSEFGEVSTLLSVPLWIPLALIVPSLVLLGFCALARIVGPGGEERS